MVAKLTATRDVADRNQSASTVIWVNPKWAPAIAQPIRHSHIRLLGQVDKGIMREYKGYYHERRGYMVAMTGPTWLLGRISDAAI
jgi:hypothetical protein